MRKVMLAAVLCALLLGLGAPAGAANYPPGGPSGGTSSGVVNPGGTITLTGSGWLPGSQVQLTLYSSPIDLGTATVAPDGTFSKTVTIPSGVTPGRHTIVMAGRDANGDPKTVSVAITVQAPNSGAESNGGQSGQHSGNIAFTGSDNAVGMTFVGAALLLIGAVLAIVARRRHLARASH